MGGLDIGRLRTMRTLDVGDLRVAGGAMLGVGLVLPHGAGVPCPLRTFTGIPCPFCGMTTSVVATLHGHIGSAVSANPAGVLAVIVAVGLLLAHRVRTVPLPVAAIPVGLGLMWLFELARFHLI